MSIYISHVYSNHNIKHSITDRWIFSVVSFTMYFDSTKLGTFYTHTHMICQSEEIGILTQQVYTSFLVLSFKLMTMFDVLFGPASNLCA